jgi:archaeal flagellar protein FlaI
MEEIESYTIIANRMEVKVSIVTESEGESKKYFLVLPHIKEATAALLDHVKDAIVTEIRISPKEIVDPKAVASLKIKFRNRAQQLLRKNLPQIAEETLSFLVSLLVHESLGLDKVEYLLNDGELEEIVILSGKEPIWVYHKKYGWLQSNLYIRNESQIQNISNIIARRIGRQVTTLNPLLDAHLLTGDRANVVLYPISSKGHTVTIRKFARDPWTVTDLINNKTCPANVFALIWLAIQYEMNILISGGTGSGKTSFLNVCMPFIPPNNRIISIEDTRELQLPKFLYWCPLTIRLPNPEGKGAVTMLDLLVNSLRMRPDRIVLGEMRKADQAEVLFEAMNTGHSVYSTVHANSLNETIRRLVNPPLNVAPNLLESVNLNVVMFRERRRSIRRLFQIGEFLVTEEEGKEVVRPNLLYRWKPETDEIIKHGSSKRLFEDLTMHTGMTIKEINDDLVEKEKILNWMVKNKIRQIQDVGAVFHEYYLDPTKLRKKIK